MFTSAVDIVVKFIFWIVVFCHIHIVLQIHLLKNQIENRPELIKLVQLQLLEHHLFQHHSHSQHLYQKECALMLHVLHQDWEHAAGRQDLV